MYRRTFRKYRKNKKHARFKTRYADISLETIQHYAEQAGVWCQERKQIALLAGLDVQQWVDTTRVQVFNPTRYRFWMMIFKGVAHMEAHQHDKNPYLGLPTPDEIHQGMCKTVDLSQRLFVALRRYDEFVRILHLGRRKEDAEK